MREIIKTLPEVQGEPFFTRVCGTSYYTPGQKLKKSIAKAYRFGYVISGKGALKAGGKKYTLEACDVFYIPAGCEFECSADKKDNLSIIWFDAQGELIGTLAEIYRISATRIFRNCRIFNLFDEFCKNINTMIDRKSAERDNAIILHQIISEISAKTKEPEQQSDDDATTLMEYIDSNYQSDITNKYLASIIGKSESQTIRTFKKAFMKTPYEYVIEKRLEAAKQMLGSTGLSVRDIAYALGFSNEHYFSSCFKAHEGMTPLQYKKSIC